MLRLIGKHDRIRTAPINTSNTPGTVTYHITPSIGSCNGVTKDYVVTVEPVPTVNGSNITICSGSNATVALDASPQNVSGTTFSWTIIPSANVTGASTGNGSLINQVLTLTDYSVGTVTYRVTPTAYNCNGSFKDIIVTVNPIATVNAGADYALCQPTTIALSGTIGGAATSGTWQIVSGNGSISASATTGSTVTATYTVVGTDIATTAIFRLVTNDPDGLGIGCTAVSDDLNVAINKAPTVSLPGDFTVCEPTTISLTGNIGGSATSGVWSIITGNGTLSSSNVSGTTTKIVTSTYQVDPTDVTNTVTFRLTTDDSDGSGPCTAVYSDINIKINRAPQIFVASSTIAICQDQKNVPLGGSYGGSTQNVLWTLGTNAGGSFSNASDVAASYTPSASELSKTAPYTLSLKLTALDPDGTGANGPCTAVSTQLSITINPLPNPVSFTGLPQNGTPSYTFQNIPPFKIQGTKIGGQFTVRIIHQ
ncbi:MAG: hypothetical protein QM734_13800 [Cyclobacteriaceae bacterium]